MTLLLLSTWMLAQSDAIATVKSSTFNDDQQWKFLEATVRLGVRFGEGNTGSAVIVAQKDQHLWALTAYHVIRESSQIEAEFFQRAIYPARARTQQGVIPVEKNAKIDVALVKIPITGDVPTPELMKMLPPGQRTKRFPMTVLAVGCDDGFSPKCFEDKLLAKRLIRRPESQIAFFWETAGAPREGRSGGGLFDEKGFVFGICAATQDGKGYYTHSDEIHAWLKSKGYSWLWDDTGKK